MCIRDRLCQISFRLVRICLIQKVTGNDFQHRISQKLQSPSRICFCVIPELGRSNPEFDLPEGVELERMRDRIDGWRELHCFRTTEDGIDIPVAEYRTDLSYVCLLYTSRT